MLIWNSCSNMGSRGLIDQGRATADASISIPLPAIICGMLSGCSNLDLAFEFMQFRKLVGFNRALLRIYQPVVLRVMSTEEPVSKKARMMKIGTHNGTFHCDEVFACFMLKQLPQFKDAEIVRTRDPKLLETCDIVVDVGGVYDAEKNRFDHHQKTFSESMHSLRPEKKWTTKLSSAGLVYLHFGQQLIAKLIGSKVDDDMTDIIYDKIYEMFVEEVDAVDNGINQRDGEPRYAVTSTLGSRVGYLNPRWNEESSGEIEMKRFQSAMKLVGEEFLDRVDYYSQCWLPARKLVEDAMAKRLEVDASGEIVRFDRGCPWKEHMHTLEEELNISPKIKFALFPDHNGKWRVQCVPKILGSFENRLSLPEEWRGLRDEELSKLSGIPGCIFVHSGGFIGGNETLEGAVEMAQKTLQGKPKLE